MKTREQKTKNKRIDKFFLVVINFNLRKLCIVGLNESKVRRSFGVDLQSS